MFNAWGQIKLGNFDQAFEEESDWEYVGGSPAYWAPGIFMDDEKTNYRLSPKRDVWGLGVTMLETILGRLPYLEETDDEINTSPYSVVQNIITWGPPIKNLNNIKRKAFDDGFGSDKEPEIVDFLIECINQRNINDLVKTSEFGKITKDLTTEHRMVQKYVKMFKKHAQKIRKAYDEGYSVHKRSEDDLDVINGIAQVKKHLIKSLLMNELENINNIDELINADINKLDKYRGLVKKLFNAAKGSTHEIYDVFDKSKGEVLIINNYTWWKENPIKEKCPKYVKDEESSFPGSEKDTKRLKELFTKLGFNVTAHENRTVGQMRDILKNFAASLAKSPPKSYFVFIMSHGDYEKVIFEVQGEDKEMTMECIYGANTTQNLNWEAISTMEIFDYFDGQKHPEVANIPKFFFIDACRGGRKDPGVEVFEKLAYEEEISDQASNLASETNSDLPDDEKMDTSNSLPTNDTDSGLPEDDRMDTSRGNNSFKRENTSVTSSNNPAKSVLPKGKTIKIPSDANRFIFYATTPLKVAHYYTDKGGKFSIDVCDVFQKYAHKWSYHELTDEIKRRVASSPSNFKEGPRFQQPQTSSTSNKEFYIFPFVEKL